MASPDAATDEGHALHSKLAKLMHAAYVLLLPELQPNTGKTGNVLWVLRSGSFCADGQRRTSNHHSISDDNLFVPSNLGAGPVEEEVRENQEVQRL